MLYNVFAFDPNHYDRGSYTFLGRMDSSIPFPINELLSIETAIGYKLGFYSDDDVLDVENEERERIGGSIFNLDSENIFNDIPVCVYDLDDFMNTLREFIENNGLSTEVDDEVLDAAFNGEVTANKDEEDTVVKSKTKVYPKVPFKVRKKDYGSKVSVEKVSSTVSMARIQPCFYDESAGDSAEDFVPDRAASKVSAERMGDLTWESVPRLVRHLPDSPLKNAYWILRSSRFKNIDFTGMSKRDALVSLRFYVAYFDNN